MSPKREWQRTRNSSLKGKKTPKLPGANCAFNTFIDVTL